MISFSHVSKTFGTPEHPVYAVQDVSLEIREGEIFGIIGFSGAGKSTLVRCINLLERPTQGSVVVDGREMTGLSPAQLRQARKKIGMIFQHFNLMPSRTVFGNVAYPLRGSGLSKRQVAEKVRRLLALVDIADKENAYPSQLSGGQKQRVAIARALSTSPKYLLCDEATSALDPNTTRSILELLRQINRDLGVTIIIITHEMKVIDQICDRVAVIDHSSIAEEGKVSDVFTNPQSQIARELILPQDISAAQTSGGAQLRIIFSGESAKQPVLSQLTLECQVPVNILFADTKEVEGKAYGQMLLELPCDENQAEKVRTWLRSSGIQWKEESK